MIVKYGMNSKQTTTTSGHSQPQTPGQLHQSASGSPHSPDSPQSVGTIPSSASIMAHSISGVGVQSVGGGSQASGGGRRRRSPEDQNNNNDSDTRSNSSGSRSGIGRKKRRITVAFHQ